MVTGRAIRYHGQYGDSFRDFLQSVDHASVTYKVEIIDSDGEQSTQPDIRFNLYSSVDKFLRALEKEYNDSCNELENLLGEIYYKPEKLGFIARCIIEVQAAQRLLVHSGQDGYRHHRFVFSNISKEEDFKNIQLSQADFQTFFFWMDQYLQKMGAFLAHLKHTIEIIPQSDFKLPIKEQKDPDSSSIDRPVGFFEFLLLQNGIAKLRNQFIPTEEDYEYLPYIHYDPKTEIITTQEQDNETGEWEEHKSAFKDHLFSRVYKEYLNSRQFIDDYIYTLRNEDDIKLFIKLSLAGLVYMATTLDKNRDAKKYDFIPRPLHALIKYFYERYSVFCPDADDRVKLILNLSQTAVAQGDPHPKQLPSTKGVQTFTALKQHEGFALILHGHLIKAHLIAAETSVDNILKAFNGSFQDTPLQVRWTDVGKNKQVNKHSLFYLLNELAKAKLITEDSDNKTFLQRMGFVFADGKGMVLQNLKVSNATAPTTSKGSTPARKAINSVIAELKMLPDRQA